MRRFTQADIEAKTRVRVSGTGQEGAVCGLLTGDGPRQRVAVRLVVAGGPGVRWFHHDRLEPIFDGVSRPALGRALAGAAMALMTTTAAMAADVPAPVVSVPDAAPLISTAEAAIRDTLVDPDSARFRAEGTATHGWAKHGLFGQRIEGPVATVCGQFNARNRMGGYSGFAWFLVTVKDGRVLWSDVDDATDQPGIAYYGCRNSGLAG